MAAYIMVEIAIHDAQTYERYKLMGPPSIAAYGGRYLVRGGAVEVLEGLAPGARVVTTGAFLLKTEILKDAIGAGCCEGGE